MRKPCRLIVRAFTMPDRIIADEKYNSKIEAKKAFHEKYGNLCNVEYAIFGIDEKPRYKYY